MLFLGLGCSSKTAKSDGDGSVYTREVGKAVDARSVDRGAADLDGDHDAGGDNLAALDAGDPCDAANTPDGASHFGSSELDASDGAIPKDTVTNHDDVADAPRAPDARAATTDTAIDVVRLGSCAFPIDISPDLVRADIAVDTNQAPHILDFPCGGNGADVVLRFQVDSPQLVYADTLGTTWNTMLFFSDACDTAQTPPGVDTTSMTVCSDDACGTGQSQAVAALGYGWHYLIVSGANGESGSATVHFQRALVGNGPLAELPEGSISVQGTTSGSDSAGEPQCEAAGPKNSYWWLTCPDYVGGDLQASTCQGATWDTVLSLQIPRNNTLSCNDDDKSCGRQSTLGTTVPPGAGIQVLTVGGGVGNSMGDYNLTFTRP